jgi:hypothetical protein
MAAKDCVWKGVKVLLVVFPSLLRSTHQFSSIVLYEIGYFDSGTKVVVAFWFMKLCGVVSGFCGTVVIRKCDVIKQKATVEFVILSSV